MLITRRNFVLSSAVLSLAGISGPAWSTIDPKLGAVLDAITDDVLASSPETLSYLGIDTGAQSAARSRLDERSLAARTKIQAHILKHQMMLAAVDRTLLKGRDQLLYDSAAYLLANGVAGGAFPFGKIDPLGGGHPYVISQQDGAYQELPEFLDSVHPVANRGDPDAYLSRLSALPTALNQETEQARRDAERGVIPPDFILDTALNQLRGLRATPVAAARLVTALTRRTAAKRIEGDWSAKAERIVTDSVYPALERQIRTLTKLRSKATPDAGVWKLPQGDAYYAWLLQYSTSTDLSPEAVRAMGLEQGRALDARIDAVLKSQGMAQGTVGERLQALTRDPRQLFPDNDAGRSELIAFVNQKLTQLRSMLPLVSRMKMAAPVQVRRAPPDIEAGAQLGYMNFGSLDGTRPAIYYINLKTTSDWPKYTLSSLTAHEGLPGHTWQGAYIAEHQDEVPLIASLMFFNAYTEGWALYSEQLIDERGFYKDDPFGQIGMLQALRFRAARLVVDTGIHAKRWSRKQAINYLLNSTGRPQSALTSEIDRYCVSPG